MATAARGAWTRWREIRATGWTAAGPAAYLPAIWSFAVVTAVGIAGGGFRPEVWRLGTVALLALAAARLVVAEQIELRRREWAMLGALASLGAWTAASALWSIHQSNSVLESERVLLYVAGLTVVLLAVERASLPYTIGGATVGITAVSAVGLGEQYLMSHPRSPIEGTLLFQPLGYANALGIYAVIGILLAFGLALHADRWRARAIALAPCLVLIPTLSLTSSRGAWAALPVGAGAMLYFSGRIRSRAVLSALLVAGILVAILIGSNKGQTLSIAGGYRTHYWAVAFDEYKASPLHGDGAGTFGDYFWRYHRPAAGFALDAHNLYLETLAELGPLGLVLLVSALSMPLVNLRGRQDPLVAAAGGAYIAFLLHAGMDWDWKVPAVTTTALFCAAAVLVGTRRGRFTAISARTRSLLVAAAIALAVVAFIRFETGPGLGS